MVEPKGKDKSFQFVNYSSLGDTPNGEARRQVRSQATRWRHSQSRARLRSTAQSLIPDSPRRIDSVVERSYRSTVPRTPHPRGRTTIPARSPAYYNSYADQASTEDEYINPDTDETKAEATLFSPEACRIASSGLTKSFSQGAMAFKTIALQDSANIVGLSLHDMRLELSSVMSLYRSICEMQAVDFSQQYAIKGDASSWGRFYSFVFTDPILLSTAVLLGVRNQLDVTARCIEGQTFAGVLHIEQFLMRSISEALGDPVRGISDQMLIAVALCAAYEIKHGSGACYHVHMQGLVQMVNLRGGLVAIGSPDPYIVRLLIWIDVNTSRLAVCRPYFEGKVHGLSAHPRANTPTFRTKGIAA